MQWVIGVDEAGRGALAGPVCVGAVLYPSTFNWREVFALVTRGEPRLRDSKQLSAQQRELIFSFITNSPRLHFSHAFVSAKVIDEIGISNAAREAAAMAVRALPTPPRVKVLLDAGLSVSSDWDQESFIKGDERVPAIALASVVAKVMRDRLMEELSETHSVYGFEQHKGYGTLAHRRAIRQNGQVLGMHRSTFIH